jgi:uncharacterized protein
MNVANASTSPIAARHPIAKNGRDNMPDQCMTCPKPGWGSIHRSIPSSLSVHTIDLDVTEACNLACTYCFKWQKKAVHMDEATAKNAIDWLLEASGNYRGELKVNFMGGEPTLRFDLIKKIVPYGKCRARQLGKSLHFGCTTNCTLITDELLTFWRRFGMGFHCSIDGIPEVQDANRPTLGGGRSSSAVETNAPKILAYRPEVMGRATITPRSAPVLLESAKYLVGLGFRSITFKSATNCGWQPSDYKVLRSQYQKLGEFYLDSLLSGKPLRIEEFDMTMRTIHSKSLPMVGCGAGSGLILIDPRGDIWPCHRFGPHQCGGQFRFGKLGLPFNDRLRNVFLRAHMVEDIKLDCQACPTRLTCVGWCSAECFDSTGDIYRPSPDFCEIMKVIHEQMLYFHNYLRSHHPNLLANCLKEN